MRNRLLVSLLLLTFGAAGGAITMSLTRGQTPPAKLPTTILAPEEKAPPIVFPPVDVRPVSTNPVVPKVTPVAKAKAYPFDRFRDLKALPEITRQMVMSAQLGMEWLHRYHQPNGLFLPGYLPAVNQPLEGDHYLLQVKSAFVLARAARFTGDDRYAVRASQAVLTMMTGTTLEGGTRRPAQPSVVCNRLGAAAWLVMAIHELPDPAAELVAKADELCAFIMQQQRADGSLHYVDSNDNPLEVDPSGVNHYPGPAMCAIALSCRGKASPAKSQLLGQALPYYRKWFREHPDPTFAGWMTAACVEAWLLTKENGFAEFAFEMTDWLCTLQHEQSPDPRKPMWRGGFKVVSNGKVESETPNVDAALYAQAIADCCRLVRQMPTPNVERYEKYRSALIRALQFVSTLQFTDSNTLHIAANYRLMLVGGFHPTHLDGNLRVDQSAQAVSAFIQFLASGADRTQ
jgi:hypothetical protein